MTTDLPKRRVVIADDDPHFCRLLNKLVGTWGYEPVVAQNGYEASQILLAEPDTSLAVFDWEMPTMDGVAACRFMRQHRQADDLYIMMVTVKNQTNDLITALDAGASDMLGKSFHPLELKAKLAAAERQLAARRERLKAVLQDGALLKGPVCEEPIVRIAGVGQEIAPVEHDARVPLNLPAQSMIPSLNTRSLQFAYRLDESHLQEGVQRGHLRPHLMDRALVCPRCESLPSFRHGCPCCGSGRIEQESLIHHFACANVGSVAAFETEHGMACPKCRARHLTVGADFEYQQGPLRCLDCKWSPRELELIGHCLRCEFRFPANQARVKDLIAYVPRDSNALLTATSATGLSHNDCQTLVSRVP